MQLLNSREQRRVTLLVRHQQVLRQQVDQAPRFRSLTPVIRLKDAPVGIALAKREPHQRFVNLMLAFEECHAELVLVQASAMNLDFLCSKLIKVFCRVQIAAVFGDLRYDRIAREKVQWNRRFLDELPDVLRVRYGFVDFPELQSHSGEKHQRQRAF